MLIDNVVINLSLLRVHHADQTRLLSHYQCCKT